MSFHAGADYAGYFGLDADTNDLAWGGWSVGAVKHRMFHAGNSAQYTSSLNTKLGGIATSANNYSLPAGSSSTRGGFKIGYSESGKNYPVELSSEKMYVNVPWSDTNTNTTYSGGTGITLSGTTFNLTDTAAKLNLSGGTMTGALTLSDHGYSLGNEYHKWKREYSVNASSPQEILDRGGSSLTTGGVYRFTAHISGTGTDQFATAVYWNQNGTWRVNVTGQSGTSSNHPEFIISASTNKPTIHIDHGSSYGISILGERIELGEGTGTDNAGYAFGTDAFLGSVGDSLYFNAQGTTATGVNSYDDGYKIFHDAYHPNADILTTSRYISLGGDLSGSAQFNGGSDITITAAVANDSHTHDGRYYTETETVNLLDLKANLSSPALTGTPTATTPSLSDNNTNIATTEYVKGQSYLTSIPTTLSGNRTIGGDLTVSGNQIFTSTTAADVKLGVWNSTTYGIGMQPGVTFGGLNDYAMTFCMNNDSDRGFWWGYAGQTKSAGAMSLTTAGVLTVNSSIATGGLTATGDTGIGTTSPTELLHIRKAQSTSASVDPFLKLQPTSTTNSTGLTSIFLGCTTASTPYGISLSGWRNPTDNEAFVIKTHSGSANGTKPICNKKEWLYRYGNRHPVLEASSRGNPHSYDEELFNRQPQNWRGAAIQRNRK